MMMNSRIQTGALTLALLAALTAATPARSAEAAPAPASAPAKAPVESLMTMPVEGSVTIDTAGNVESYRIDTKVIPSLQAILDDAIRGWKFRPVLIDGQPTRALARMRVVLAAVPAGKDYHVRIDNVVFLEPDGKDENDHRVLTDKVDIVGKSMRPPVYPGGALMAGVAGRVLLALQVDADGHVVNVESVQSMAFDVRGREGTLREAIAQLEKAAVQGARRWTFDVKVKPGAATTAKDFTAMTTVEFVLSNPGQKSADGDKTGEWRYVSRLPRREISWLRDFPDLPQVGVADVANGEVVPLAGSVRLSSPVDGGAQ
jgi:TonB family protein